ncbi:biotin-independent malonate decarboxylase subunit beta (plasmid) [Lichenicola cladoniae]|uniref:Biotin-independent malonate decarboxylase subunit beta n=1 Tax=Lichenicola cladoniae TaxID=1484109 RepID=A0A6M8HYT6_9PROT|nr:biotin-independent malonate decarboxylase subunit beta [Lichenicola cladoniae]NPD66794.1 biotin-independent malonate decarboxylase subunit beta [Acetobacteraceae bacterium]QKE93508.1 biotin-independent malonate decarboxylase subunit beta [Lichenicola cladoniae]
MDTQPAYGHSSWLQSTARQRITGLLDPHSFTEFLQPIERVQSPHLHLFDLPSAFDDGVVIGRGSLDGTLVLLAAQEGQFMGGTFGEVSGAKIVGLLRAARDHQELPRTVLLLLDSGGVRLQEANAGELAVAEIMRAVIEARCAGVAVIALVGGKAGAFGGAGLTAATCSRIIVSEQGRIGVSGPEVIETNKGVDEFDSKDKALVWSVAGGKNRRLIGGADAFTADSMDGFRTAAKAILDRVPSFDLRSMRAEQDRLAEREKLFGGCTDAVSMWKILGIDDPEAVSAMDTDGFVTLANSIKGANHDAR